MDIGQPNMGVTEITGVGILSRFRRRGTVAWLTSEALDTTFSWETQTARLTAADENAGRVNTWTGSSPFSIMLADIDSFA